MVAMILCAGKGTRLGKLTEKMAKALLPVGGKPAVVHIIKWLKRFGVFGIVINLHHFGGQIQEAVGNGSEYGAGVTYSLERELLGTAGGVKNAGVFLSNPFIVVNGDTLHDFNLVAMIGFHKKNKALATMALCGDGQLGSGGFVEMEECWVRSFVETQEKGQGLVSAGVYVCQKEMLDYVPDGFSDFGYDIFPKLVKLDVPLCGYVLPRHSTVVDIGTLEGYGKAKRIFGG